MVDLTAAAVAQAARDRVDRETAVRNELNKEAERVMNESKPTPTQAEMDAIKLGTMRHDEKEDPNNPKMPSLGEQQSRIADAGNESAAYRTRQMKPGRSGQDDEVARRDKLRRSEIGAQDDEAAPKDQRRRSEFGGLGAGQPGSRKSE